MAGGVQEERDPMPLPRVNGGQHNRLKIVGVYLGPKIKLKSRLRTVKSALSS